MPQQSAAPTQVVTSAQLAGMTPQQRSAYLASLDPAAQAQAMQDYSGYQTQMNAVYLANSVEKIGTCYPASGGITQNYAVGQTLVYNFPTASGAFAKDLLITMSLNFTPATGTSAVYAYTPSAPYSFFNEIQILFNGTQARIRPYLMRVLEMMRSRQNPPPGQVPSSANAVATITTNVATPAPTLTGGSAAQLTQIFRIPLNVLHQLSPIGMLPIQGSGTKAQVLLLCASAVLGPDPMFNSIYAVSGSGHAITFNAGSTVKVEVVYMDGSNMTSPVPLSLDLTGVPTAQYMIDTPLTPLAASITQRQRIAVLLEHYYVVAVVIDGNQSNKFAAVSNITSIELDQDSIGQNKFFYFGVANNVSIYDWYEYMRHVFQQDFDEGVIVWVNAEAYGQENPDNRIGNRALNMTAGGWTDVHHGYLLTTVNGLGTVTARVELYLISMNRAGLVQG